MKTYFSLLFVLFTLTLTAQNNRSALIPMPNHIEQTQGKPFNIDASKVSIYSNRVTYMTYPRGLALAEAGWTQMECRDWESFKERMYPNLTNLMKAGVSVRVPFEIVKR